MFSSSYGSVPGWPAARGQDLHETYLRTTAEPAEVLIAHAEALTAETLPKGRADGNGRNCLSIHG